MSRLFFISFNCCDYPYEVYPLGMAVVAASAQQQGHAVNLYDYLMHGQNDDHLIQSAKDFGPDYICISIRNLDEEIDSSGCIDNTKNFLMLANRIKTLKKGTAAAVILGGAAVSLAPETLLNLTGADYAVVGEGEKALCGLISNLQKSEPCKRIFSSADFPLLDKDIKGALYCPDLVRWYYEKSGFISVQTKRGCPFHCLYCTYPSLEGHCFRCRDKESVVDEIRRLRTDYGCRNIFFVDSVFNDPAGNYKEIVEAIIQQELDIQWSAYFSPYRLTQPDMELCKRSGLYAIELGTDASNSTTLAGLNKMFDWPDVIKANKIITDAELACAHFIIFGGPDETYQTLEEGIKNCVELEKCVVFGYTGIRIYPGAPLFDRALAEGLIQADTTLFEPMYYFSPEVEKEKMNKMIEQGWSRQRHLVFPPERGKMKAQALKTMFNAKGLIWDQMCRI